MVPVYWDGIVNYSWKHTLVTSLHQYYWATASWMLRLCCLATNCFWKTTLTKMLLSISYRLHFCHCVFIWKAFTGRWLNGENTSSNNSFNPAIILKFLHFDKHGHIDPKYVKSITLKFKMLIVFLHTLI